MDNTMKSVAFHNLGCKVNGYEMDYMQQNLQERGYIGTGKDAGYPQQDGKTPWSFTAA